MENKSVTRAAILIATFLMSIPLVPVNATPTTNVIVSLGTVDFGGTLTTTIAISGVSNLAGYDIGVLVNPRVLTLTGASLSGTLFDAANACSTSNPNLVLPCDVNLIKKDVIPSRGIVRMAVAMLGGTTITSTGGAIFTFTATVNDASNGQTAADYPSTITVVTSTLVNLINSVANIIPSTNGQAMYMPPSDLGVASCGAQFKVFDTFTQGLLDPVSCNIVNLAGTSISARADFSFRSHLLQLTGSSSSPSMTLAPFASGTATSTHDLTLPPVIVDKFTFNAHAIRLVTFNDGSVLAILGPSATFVVHVHTTSLD